MAGSTVLFNSFTIFVLNTTEISEYFTNTTPFKYFYFSKQRMGDCDISSLLWVSGERSFHAQKSVTFQLAKCLSHCGQYLKWWICDHYCFGFSQKNVMHMKTSHNKQLAFQVVTVCSQATDKNVKTRAGLFFFQVRFIPFRGKVKFRACRALSWLFSVVPNSLVVHLGWDIGWEELTEGLWINSASC